MAQEEQLTVANAIYPETDAVIQEYLINGDHLAQAAPRRVLSPIEAAAGGGGGGGGGTRGIKGALKMPQTFITPTNPPSNPPTSVAPGYSIRVMPPNSVYKNGYWRMYYTGPNGTQAVNPATLKQPTGSNLTRAEFNAQTHVALPPGR